MEELDGAALEALRSRARVLADTLGYGAVAAGLATMDSRWFFADTASNMFGREVADALTASDISFVERGTVGLVSADSGDGELSWSTCERVRLGDKEDWLKAKREGGGRDPRLLPSSEGMVFDIAPPAVTSGKQTSTPHTMRDTAERATLPPRPQRLFREAFMECSRDGALLRPRFQGVSAMLALGQAMCSSGLEPDSYRSEFYRSSGLSPKSSLGIEFGYWLHCIFLCYCVDGLDGTRLASMEHAARRVLQIQRAVREGGGKGPCFDGLSAYMQHADGSSGIAHVPMFDAWLADQQKSQGFNAHALKSAKGTDDPRAEKDKDKKDKKDKKGDKGGAKGNADG